MLLIANSKSMWHAGLCGSPQIGTGQMDIRSSQCGENGAPKASILEHVTSPESSLLTGRHKATSVQGVREETQLRKRKKKDEEEKVELEAPLFGVTRYTIERKSLCPFHTVCMCGAGSSGKRWSHVSLSCSSP